MQGRVRVSIIRAMEAETPPVDPGAPADGASARRDREVKGFRRISVFDEIPEDDLAGDAAAFDDGDLDHGDYVPV